MNLRRGLLCGLFPVLACAGAGAAPREVAAFNTYLGGPYRVDAQHGLAQSLVERLNRKLGPALHINLNHMPRIRVDAAELSKGARFDGLLLFVNPRFVGDAAQTRFLWSKPLFFDCNLVISRAAAPLEYGGPATFGGRRFGGVRGYRYPLIDDLVRSGALQREDSQDELSGLRKLARERIDLTVMPYSVFSYLATDSALAAQLHVARKPYECFARHILVGKSNPALLAALNLAIDGLAADQEWLRAMAYFHLDPKALSGWSAQANKD